jgi:threonine dehydratase
MQSATAIYQLDFNTAKQRIQNVALRTPLQLNLHLSKKYNCKIYLKREDLQVVRSYKLRGAYNMMSSLSAEQLQRGGLCQCG